jgi:quinol-cytochrome oxidoreductase complex cytochrome b subunit
MKRIGGQQFTNAQERASGRYQVAPGSDDLLDRLAFLLSALLAQKSLSPEDASAVVAYSTFIYLIAFSIALFVLRFLGLFAAALGIPNEEQIRLNPVPVPAAPKHPDKSLKRN